MNRFVIVSGLPASGKSTLARAIAPALALPVFDKDDFLEALFDRSGASDAASRHALSRAADLEFRNQVERSAGGVITSWWKHPLSSSDSGTPIDWLASLSGRRVEVHCRCQPATAAARFLARRRHPVHLDHRWSYEELVGRFTRDASQGPLGIGHVVEVETDGEIRLAELLRQIEQFWPSVESTQRNSAS